jgi:uncharacterized membrane protein
MTVLPPPDPVTRVTRGVAAATDRYACAAWLLVTGGVGAGIGSILPWGRLSTYLGEFAVAGTRGDGRFTLAAGLFVAAIGALVLFARASYNLVVLGLVGACGIVAIAGYNALNVAAIHAQPEVMGVIDVGYGLWLTLAAGVSAIVGGALLVHEA